MRARTASASLLVAVALAVSPMTAAVADGSTDTSPGVTRSAEAKLKAQARKLERAANARGAIVLGGEVQSVAGQILTFTVHGGRYKVLRGTDLTVIVAFDAKITKNETEGATLADLVAGDHVVVKSRAFDFIVDTSTDPATMTVTVTATVTRVAASTMGG